MWVAVMLKVPHGHQKVVGEMGAGLRLNIYLISIWFCQDGMNLINMAFNRAQHDLIPESSVFISTPSLSLKCR
jgi:hypothetical protein